jgi:hypothetical protein
LLYLCPMEKEFVTYEIALELKSLGFNEPCWGYYDVDEGYSIGYAFCYSNRESQPEIGCSAPPHQQVFGWFEDNYSYFVDIKTDTTPNEILGFDYTIKSWKFPPMYFDFFKDKREGNIAVIKKMIEMVKKEKQKEALIELMDNDKDLDK